VPRSLREDFAAGRITLEQIRARSPAPARPTYTAKGQEAATAFRMWSTEDNPRLSCKPTSVIFDWTFDWPINRVTQTTVDGEKVIDLDYGLFSASRRIHLGMAAHPANLTPQHRSFDRPGRGHARRRHHRVRGGRARAAYAQ
jgi:hypothetical protein